MRAARRRLRADSAATDDSSQGHDDGATSTVLPRDEEPKQRQPLPLDPLLNITRSSLSRSDAHLS